MKLYINILETAFIPDIQGYIFFMTQIYISFSNWSFFTSLPKCLIAFFPHHWFISMSLSSVHEVFQARSQLPRCLCLGYTFYKVYVLHLQHSVHKSVVISQELCNQRQHKRKFKISMQTYTTSPRSKMSSCPSWLELKKMKQSGKRKFKQED